MSFSMLFGSSDASKNCIIYYVLLLIYTVNTMTFVSKENQVFEILVKQWDNVRAKTLCELVEKTKDFLVFKGKL